MKKALTVIAATLALAASGSVLAKQPVPMSDAQMDKVTAGAALIDVVVVDVADINNVLNNNDVVVAIPVNAAVAILGIAGAQQRGINTGTPGRRR